MKNGITKTATLIISVIITVGLLIGYETFRLSSVLKEKRELTAQLGGLIKEKASLGNDLSKYAVINSIMIISGAVMRNKPEERLKSTLFIS